jgi:hypothetical protein
MDPIEKRLVMTIVERNGDYTTKCMHENYSEAHVPYQEMQKLRVFIMAALENPNHLDLGMPEVDPGGNVALEFAAAVAAQLPVTHGLPSIQFKPADLFGEALFAHMVAYCARISSQAEPSKHLEVGVSPEQEPILAPGMQDLLVQAILKVVATKKTGAA